MRSFSNIMPNFADKLHLLVDSIGYFFKRANKRKTGFSFVLRLFIRNFALCKRELTPSRQKKKCISFVLLSTFRNFARILSFSLYKGSLGN